MQDYSEDYHCAGWLSGLEFLLWEKPTDEGKSPSAQVLSKIRGELRALAKIAGGWWVYEDETQPDKAGPIFISMERWLQILAKTKRETAPVKAIASSQTSP
jgi:hypothetical protein